MALPERQAVRLADSVSFDIGASLGIPALTAHICLTSSEFGPPPPRAGCANGANGAGCRRGRSGRPRCDPAGALGRGAGDRDRERRREGDACPCGWRSVTSSTTAAPSAAEEILRIAPDGVDVVVEVAAGVERRAQHRGSGARTAPSPRMRRTVAVSSASRSDDLMGRNVRYQFVLVYTVPSAVKDAAVADVAAAAADGALEVGADAGLPLHRFPLDADRRRPRGGRTAAPSARCSSTPASATRALPRTLAHREVLLRERPTEVLAGRSVFVVPLGPVVCLVQWLPIAGRLKPAADPPEFGQDALQHIYMVRGNGTGSHDETA